jgi:cell division protein FtsQ
VPIASSTFEKVAGRPPAYYSRRLRVQWAVWRRPLTLLALFAAAMTIGFAEIAKPVRSGATDGVHAMLLAAGLRVGAIVIEGDDGVPDADVIDAISPFQDMALPFFDADAARERILAIPRVRTATVMKLYPNTLHLRISEREPFGLWQRGGQISVIDEEGRVVREVPDDTQVMLPLFVGEGANVQAQALEAALADAPAVRSRVVAAVRIADRRWDLKLDNDVAVQLPETDAARAVGVLATMLRQPNFFDQPIRIIDLRLADRVTLTLTEEGAIARRTIMERRETGAGERQT